MSDTMSYASSATAECQASVQEKLCLAFNVLCITAILGLLMWAFQKGFDFTDEAGSLLSTEQPWAEKLRPTEFAMYTHYLYMWAGEDLFLFRLYGLLLLLVTNAYFAYQMTQYMAELTPATKLTSINVGLAIWISITAYYCKWYPAPNYYTLCLLGMVLAAGVTLQILRARRKNRFCPMLFFALGLSLAVSALGRAPSAALMAVPVTCLILWAYRRNMLLGFGGLVITGIAGVCALLAHMIFMAEGVKEVIQIYYNYISMPGRIEGTGHDAGSQFDGLWQGLQRLCAALWKRGWLFGLLAGFALLARHPKLATHFRWRNMSASVLILLLLTQSRWMFKSYGDPSEVAATMLFVMLAALMLTFLIVPPYAHESRKGVWLWGGVLLAFLSWVMAFGSNVPFLWQASRAIVFIAAAILCVGWGMGSAPLRQGLSSLVCAATLSILLAATISTYRQDSLWLHDTPVTMRGPGTEIDLWPEAADYIHKLRTAADAAGWQPGMMIFDLGGGNAGIAYVLRAKIPIFPRVCGGYESSAITAQQVADSFSPEEKATLWLVTSDSPARISDEVLLRNFPNFPQGYEKVIELPSMGDRHRVPLPTEYVWRPIVE